jgi:protein-disulfide isomerase
MENSKNTVQDMFPFIPAVQLGIVVLLAGVAFYAGTLWTKTKGSALGTATNNPTAVAPTPSAPSAAQPSGQQPSSAKSLSSIAGDLGVDVNAFKSCLDSDEMAAVVDEDLQSGSEAGVQGTPGSILVDKQTGNSYLIPGAYPYTDVKKLYEDIKAGKTPQLGGKDAEKVTTLAAVTDKDHMIGNKDGRFYLVEYSDFECPFCKKFHPTAVKFYKDNNDVAWVYRHFPLDFHATAQKSAEASECIAKLGGNDAFWKFNEVVAGLSAVSLN